MRRSPDGRTPAARPRASRTPPPCPAPERTPRSGLGGAVLWAAPQPSPATRGGHRAGIGHSVSRQSRGRTPWTAPGEQASDTSPHAWTRRSSMPAYAATRRTHSNKDSHRSSQTGHGAQPPGQHSKAVKSMVLRSGRSPKEALLEGPGSGRKRHEGFAIENTDEGESH